MWEKKRKYVPVQLILGVFLLLMVIVPEKVIRRQESPGQSAELEIMTAVGQMGEETAAGTVRRLNAERADPTADSLTLNSQAAVLMDGDSGRILYGKNETTILPMASTTKIMTCILALENGDMDMEVPVTERAQAMPEVRLGIKKGETYHLGDLLYSLMLESHNDSAVAIAEALGGSVKTFADMMNRKATDIGCRDTWFVTPNGLDAVDQENGREHSTTAADLARILRYCVEVSPEKEEFLAITRAPSHAFSDLSGKRSFSCINHNALLTSMEGAVSGKTGFTGKAGYCYVGAVDRGGKRFVVALLGCGWPPHKTYKWQDVKKLVAYGDKNFEYQEIEKVPLDDTASIRVEDGVLPEVKIGIPDETKNSLRFLLGKEEKVTVRTKIAKSVCAPVQTGTPVGQREYAIGGMVIECDPIVTEDSVSKWDFSYAEHHVLGTFWL